MATDPTPPPEDRYITVATGGLIGCVHRMCRFCGALVHLAPANLPEGTLTPEMVHDRFHAKVEALLSAQRKERDG
jgi:hypothetical protein